MESFWWTLVGNRPVDFSPLPGIAKACRPSQHYQASRVLVGCFFVSQEKRRKLGSKLWLSMFEKDQLRQECDRLKWSKELDLGLENMAVCCSEKQSDSDETVNYYCSTSPHVWLQLLELRNITIFAYIFFIWQHPKWISSKIKLTMTVHTN